LDWIGLIDLVGCLVALALLYWLRYLKFDEYLWVFAKQFSGDFLSIVQQLDDPMINSLITDENDRFVLKVSHEGDMSQSSSCIALMIANVFVYLSGIHRRCTAIHLRLRSIGNSVA
jgi:hypothetical protein